MGWAGSGNSASSHNPGQEAAVELEEGYHLDQEIREARSFEAHGSSCNRLRFA